MSVFPGFGSSCGRPGATCLQRLVLAAFAACLAGCEGGAAHDCQPGTEGCACVEGACFGELACLSNTCVQLDGSDNGDPGEDEPGEDEPAQDEPQGDDSGTGESGEDTSDDRDDAPPEEGGPEIIDIGTNTPRITDGESVTFTATVIDPNGPSDIQGGSLKTDDSTLTFGAFVDAGNGTFEISISWDEIHDTVPIVFDYARTRSFRATFFDNSGKSHTRVVQLELWCGEGSKAAACGGRCVDRATDAKHCGGCGQQCPTPAGYDVGCQAGTCNQAMQCVGDGSAFSSCGQACESIEERCVECPFYLSPKAFTFAGENCTGQRWDDHYYQCSNSIVANIGSQASGACCCSVGAVF